MSSTASPHRTYPIRFLGPLAPVLILSACASTGSLPTATAVTAVPDRWQQATTAGESDPAALAAWWSRFDDPTLGQLIGQALETSPDIRTAVARVEEARARHGVQRAALLPALTASASGRNTRTTERGTDATTTAESAGASLDASWEIDLFGQTRQAYRATAADLAQAEENQRAARVTLAAEVASAYVSLRATEAKLAVVEETLGTLAENLQFTQWQEQAGTGSALDTRQALTNLEQTRASVPSLQLTLTETRNQLAVLCGRAPGSLDPLLAATGRIPAAPAALGAGIPAETLRQRPDVRAAARAVEAAAARTSAAERARFPSLSLTGSIGVDALRAGKLLSPESSFVSLLGGLSAPVFSSGRISQNIRIQAAAEQQVLIAYESAVLTALAEVENALVALQRQTERLAALDRATAAARETHALAQQRYEAGAVDFLTVLDAQRSLLSLQDARLSTASALTTAHIQLYKALGGGWSNL